MTVQMFLGMLLIFASISSLITEAIKTLINDRIKYSSNVVVLIVSIVVGGIGMYVYYVLNEITIGSKEIIYIGSMSLASWLVATLGYDKIKQALLQLEIIKNIKNLE